MACVVMGHRRSRQYGLYVSETQDQADDHVSNVAAMLESNEVAELDPALGERNVGKYGTSKGWRRNRLWTAAGLVIDALGLDSAARGAKLEEQRPDFIILDDLDNEADTVTTVEKKIRTITRKLLPAGSNDLAILAIQNLVHRDGVFAKLASDDPPFLSGRLLSGPHPALRGCEITEVEKRPEGRYLITKGDPVWEGQSLADCQRFVDKWGPSAFRAECLHEVEDERRGTLVYPSFSVEQNVTKEHPVSWKDCIYRVVGIDPGGGDPMAIVPIGVYTRPGSAELFFHQFTEKYERGGGVTTDDMVAYLSTLDKVAPLDGIWIDTAGGDTILSTIESYGFRGRIFPAIKDRAHITATIRPLIELQRITLHENCRESIREFYMYRWKPAIDPIDGSRFDTDTAVDNHADAMDARRYAVVGFMDARRRGMGATHPRSMRMEVRR